MSDAGASLVGGMSSAAIILVIIISAACSIAVVAIYHWAVARPRFRSAGGTDTTGLALDTRSLEDLRSRTAALEAATAGALQHVGFVRFNAFADVGSELSYALAAIDGRGNGFLISSIYSREEVRSYAKAIREFASDKDLSAEERRALDIAVSHAKRGRV